MWGRSDGQFLVGGGGGAENGLKFIHSSGPVDGPDGDSEPNDAWGLSVRAGSHGTDANAVAVCADTAPEVVQKVTDIPVNKTGRTTARCPSDMHVSGGGVAIDGDPPESFVNSSYPADGSDSNKTPDDGWTGRAVGPAGGTVEMQVTALCVSSARTYMPYRAGSVKPHGATASQDYCKDEAGVLSGAGLEIPGPGRQALMKVAIPNDDPTMGDPNLTPEERIVWGMKNRRGTRKTPTAYAVCKP
jgi:hypothetical protein